MDKKNNVHKFVNTFNPDISVMNIDCRDYLLDFHAGIGNENFNDFLKKEANETKDIVAYFTLSANAIPYIDRIKLDEDEIATCGMKYDEQTWGIPVLEIKMFAVNNKYQDVFYMHRGQALPIAAWCLLAIINYAKLMLDTVLGFKALFLHSILEAEQFYLKNGFQEMTHNMLPFTSIDSDMRPMWLPLKNIHMNYDK